MNLNRPPYVSNALASSLLQTPRTLRASLLLGALGIAGLAHGQALYSITEQAGPSETLCARGDALAANTVYKVYPYSSSGVRGTPVTCTTDSTNGGVALFTLPSTIADTMYEVAATTAKGTTNSLFVNRPRMEWSDVPEAMQNGVVRLVGRNFKPNASINPTVTLYNTATRISYTPTLDTVTDNDVSFHVPASATAGSYKIYFNNNLAGAASYDPNTLALTVKPQASDPFNLGVSWGADYATIAGKVFNAKTDPRVPHIYGDGGDDTACLAAALWTVAFAGGGTLYVPPGTYMIDGGQLNIMIPANVVLMGAGKGQTILRTGYRFNASNVPSNDYAAISLWASDDGIGNNGIANLTIENLNSSPKTTCVLRGGPVYRTVTKSFLKNVELKLNNGSMALTWPKKAVIADCDISSTSIKDSPIYSPNSQELQFVRNNVNYRVGRVAFGFSQRCVFEGNTIQYDNNYRTPNSPETGGIELGYGQQILLHGNNVGGYGPMSTKSWVDGELILTQYSSVNEFANVGFVKSVSGRILVAQSNWSTTGWQNGLNGSIARKYIAIVSGKGAGQWRWATPYGANSLMVDRNWQVNPDSTSRFEIQSMNCYQQTWTDNNVYGGSTGVSMWDGGIDAVVARNTLTNSGSITIRSSAQPGVSGSDYLMGPAWDVSVVDNKVTNNDGYMPACISVSAIDAAMLALPQMVTNVDVRRNVINGLNLTPRWTEINQTDGIEISSIFYSGGHSDVLTNVGTIVQSNTISGGSKVIRFSSLGDFDNDMISSL